jgi:ubiquinone/menaquinone biosynthesis C-methylase UbiE
MSDRGISAYALAERVRSYDEDMELMHPNRAKMISIALQVLPFARSQSLRAIDIGVGTGYFTERFLDRFPQASIWAIDGAEAMLEMAKARLGPRARRVRFVTGDFRNLASLIASEPPFDAVFSSYALHHLDRGAKAAVIRQIRALLAPSGWFLNADIGQSDSPDLEERIQTLRVDGIVQRNLGRDARFADAAATRRYLDELEAAEGDRPLSLSEDLGVLAEGGLRQSGVFWLEYREAVTGGVV